MRLALRVRCAHDKTDRIGFEHHVFYDGLDLKGEVSHRDVANNIVPDVFLN